jgi:transcriptional regulator with XRE-family HTH domain
MPSLAELRRSRKLTQTEVAAALGVTQATVS